MPVALTCPGVCIEEVPSGVRFAVHRYCIR